MPIVLVYNAMSLPFAINADIIKQVTDREGNRIFDAEQGGKAPEIYLYDLANVTLNSDYDSELQLQFHALKDGEDIPANQPFIIKPQEDIVEDFFFYDVTIVNPVEEAPSVDDVQFHGVFIRRGVTPEADHKVIEVATDGTLQEHTEYVSISGLSGYFVVAPTLPAYDYVVIVIDDDISTSVSEVKRFGKATKVMINQQVYILQGESVYSVTGKKQ